MNSQEQQSNGAKNHGLVALEDKISTAGCIAWWSLRGGLDLGDLRQAWDEEGLPGVWLPEPPTPNVALRRVLGELRDKAPKDTRRFLSPLKGGTTAVVEEQEWDGELKFHELLRASISKVGRPSFDRVHPEVSTRELHDAFDEQLDSLAQADVSPWLCKMLDRFSAVALRESGGIYFVPRFSMPDWEKLVRVLRETTKHVVSAVPALRSDEAATAVLEAVRIEAEKALATFETDIANAVIGARAYKRRIEMSQEIAEKLAKYGELFGQRLSSTEEKVDELRASLTVAMLREQATESAE